MKPQHKLADNKGLSYMVAILGLLVAVAFAAVILIPGYLGHLRDAKLTYDRQSVETAQDVATIQYLQDGVPGIAIYYYDELAHKVVGRDKLGSIKGYGRSTAAENANAETGAVGTPCLPEEDGGAQLLTLAVIGENIHSIRWTGKKYTYWDYKYMTHEEWDLLKAADFREMDASSEAAARRRAEARYDSDYKKQLDKGEDPGAVVYNYDLVNDVLYLDPSMTPSQTDRKDETLYRAAGEIKAYSLSDAEGNIVQVTVHGNDISLVWTEGSHEL